MSSTNIPGSKESDFENDGVPPLLVDPLGPYDPTGTRSDGNEPPSEAPSESPAAASDEPASEPPAESPSSDGTLLAPTNPGAHGGTSTGGDSSPPVPSSGRMTDEQFKVLVAEHVVDFLAVKQLERDNRVLESTNRAEFAHLDESLEIVKGLLEELKYVKASIVKEEVEKEDLESEKTALLEKIEKLQSSIAFRSSAHQESLELFSCYEEALENAKNALTTKDSEGASLNKIHSQNSTDKIWQLFRLKEMSNSYIDSQGASNAELETENERVQVSVAKTKLEGKVNKEDNDLFSLQDKLHDPKEATANLRAKIEAMRGDLKEGDGTIADLDRNIEHSKTSQTHLLSFERDTLKKLDSVDAELELLEPNDALRTLEASTKKLEQRKNELKAAKEEKQKSTKEEKQKSKQKYEDLKQKASPKGNGGIPGA